MKALHCVLGCVLLLLPAACGGQKDAGKVPPPIVKALEKKVAAKKVPPAPVVPKCVPKCTGRQCGDDGCGGTCGVCATTMMCKDGSCVAPPCVPKCEERECGPDFCGGECGKCKEDFYCQDGKCLGTVAAGLDAGRVLWPQDNLPSAIHVEALGFPADWSGPCVYSEFPREAALAALAANPYSRLLLTLSPWCGLGDYLADGGKVELRLAVEKLCAGVKAFPGKVLVSFGPGMNAPWNPWAPCNDENQDTKCPKTPEDYRKAFATLSAMLDAGCGQKVSMVFAPWNDLAYWKNKTPPWPAFEAFFPAKELVDFVGLNLVAEAGPAMPDPNTTIADFVSRIRKLAGPKPMLLSASFSCWSTETPICAREINDLASTEGFWGPWGGIEVVPSVETAPSLCKEPQPGKGSLEFRFADKKPDWYIGGFTIPLETEVDLGANGGLSLMVAHRSGDPIGVQVEICDADNPSCPEDTPCCKEEVFIQEFVVSNPAWERILLPVDGFKAAVSLKATVLNPARIRAISFHFFRPDSRPASGAIALDSLGAVSFARTGACDEENKKWASTVLSPTLCARFPELRGVTYSWGVERKADKVSDQRIHDSFFMKNLFDNTCISRTW